MIATGERVNSFEFILCCAYALQCLSPICNLLRVGYNSWANNFGDLVSAAMLNSTPGRKVWLDILTVHQNDHKVAILSKKDRFKRVKIFFELHMA